VNQPVNTQAMNTQPRAFSIAFARSATFISPPFIGCKTDSRPKLVMDFLSALRKSACQINIFGTLAQQRIAIFYNKTVSNTIKITQLNLICREPPCKCLLRFLSDRTLFVIDFMFSRTVLGNIFKLQHFWWTSRLIYLNYRLEILPAETFHFKMYWFYRERRF